MDMKGMPHWFLATMVLQACAGTIVLANDRLNVEYEQEIMPEHDFEYVITCDRQNGIYRVGEEAELTVRVRDAADATAATNGILRFDFDGYDNRVFKSETHDISRDGAELRVKAGLPHPGIMRLKIYSGRQRKFSMWGVAFDPEKIEPDVAMPPDFDEYWGEAIERYDREIPEDFKLKFDSRRSTPWNDVYRLSFTAVNGTKLYGFVSYPKDRTRKYPARFEVPSAGIGGWTMGPPTFRRDCCVTMMLNIFPFEMPETLEEARPPYAAWTKMLKEKYQTDHYMSAGLGVSREEYTLYAYLLGANRAVNWLWRQKEVDQGRFYYWGASQGGGYGTLVMGLNHHFTRGCLLVPCQTNGMGLKDRQGAFFAWKNQATPGAQANARRFLPYFAAENFARRITCPTIVAVGLCDVICPAHGGWSVYNLIPAKTKAIVCAVNQPHGAPDPVWFGTQKWMMGDADWETTFGEQLKYVHWSK